VTFLGEVKSPVTSRVELCGVIMVKDQPMLLSDDKWSEIQAHPQFDQFEFNVAKPSADPAGKVRAYSGRGRVGIAIGGSKP